MFARYSPRVKPSARDVSPGESQIGSGTIKRVANTPALPRGALRLLDDMSPGDMGYDGVVLLSFNFQSAASRAVLGGNAPEDHSCGLLDGFQALAE